MATSQPTLAMRARARRRDLRFYRATARNAPPRLMLFSRWALFAFDDAGPVPTAPAPSPPLVPETAAAAAPLRPSTPEAIEDASVPPPLSTPATASPAAIPENQATGEPRQAGQTSSSPLAAKPMPEAAARRDESPICATHHEQSKDPPGPLHRTVAAPPSSDWTTHFAHVAALPPGLLGHGRRSLPVAQTPEAISRASCGVPMRQRRPRTVDSAASMAVIRADNAARRARQEAAARRAEELARAEAAEAAEAARQREDMRLAKRAAVREAARGRMRARELERRCCKALTALKAENDREARWNARAQAATALQSHVRRLQARKAASALRSVRMQGMLCAHQAAWRARDGASMPTGLDPALCAIELQLER